MFEEDVKSINKRPFLPKTEKGFSMGENAMKAVKSMKKHK